MCLRCFADLAKHDAITSKVRHTLAYVLKQQPSDFSFPTWEFLINRDALDVVQIVLQQQEEAACKHADADEHFDWAQYKLGPHAPATQFSAAIALDGRRNQNRRLAIIGETKGCRLSQDFDAATLVNFYVGHLNI